MFRRNFSHTDGVIPVAVDHPKDAAVVAVDERMKVCELVFTPDARTKLPSSDIGVYLNSQTPQVVKDFILNNIYGDVNRSMSSKGIDDNTLHELTRGNHETVSDYAMRVTAFMNSQKKAVSDYGVYVRNVMRSRKSE